MDWLLIFFVFTALAFDFLNGFHDSANVVATAIASRAMPPNTALVMTAIANFIGPFLFGVAVATTIGDEVLAPEAVTIPVALAALLSAIVWNILTWWLGIPSSSSHALIGGFVGAAVAGYGTEAIVWSGLAESAHWSFCLAHPGLALRLGGNAPGVILWSMDDSARQCLF